MRRSLENGTEALAGLSDLIVKINKDDSLLGAPRKYVRLRNAEVKISQFQKRLPSLGMTLQISMDALVLWNQVSIQRAHEDIIPNLEELQRSIRVLATGFNGRIRSLEEHVAGVVPHDPNERLIEIASTKTLRDCVRSAATIVSSASTMLDSGQNADKETVAFFGSDFGDIFPSVTAERTLAWMSSIAVPSAAPESLTSYQSIPDLETDLDSDLDLDLANSLFKRAKIKLRTNDCIDAESLLRNCISHLNSLTSHDQAQPSRLRVSLAHDALATLSETYMRLEKYEEAAEALVEKLGLHPHGFRSKDEACLADLSNLATIFFKKGDMNQAYAHARRALTGYRKLEDHPNGLRGTRKTLALMIDIFGTHGNTREVEAYSIMLEDISDRMMELTGASSATTETRETVTYNTLSVASLSIRTSNNGTTPSERELTTKGTGENDSDASVESTSPQTRFIAELEGHIEGLT